MWYKYSLINVVIYLICQDMEYYFYDPFKENLDKTIDVWGEIKIVNFNFSKNFCDNFIPKIPNKFNGYPLSSFFFYKKPSSINWSELPKSFVQSIGDVRNYSKEFGGYDGIFYGNLMKALNFTPITKTTPIPSYGFRDKNGIFHGTIGQILYANMTISVNPHFIIDCQTNDIEYLFPLFFDKLCVIAPKALRIPQSVAVFKCYKPLTWLLLVITFILLGIIWNFFKKYGSLTTSFTTISYYKDINTLKLLSESNLYIHTTSKHLPIFGTDTDDNIIMKNLNKKFQLVPNATLSHVAYNKDRDICVMEQSSDYLIAKDVFRSADGAFLLHLIRECPRAFHSTYIVRKGWPLVERFNEILIRFASGGFYTLWYNSARNAILLKNSMNRLSKSKNLIRRPFNLNDTQIAFFVLLIGSLISFSVFLCEYFGRKK